MMNSLLYYQAYFCWLIINDFLASQETFTPIVCLLKNKKQKILQSLLFLSRKIEFATAKHKR